MNLEIDYAPLRHRPAKQARRPIRPLILLLACCTAAAASAGEDDPPSSLAIHRVTVITGDGTPPRPNRTVIVRDGRIAGVQSSAAPLPEDLEVVDAAGRYLLPGFVDTHAHLTMGPVSLAQVQGQPALTFEPLRAVMDSSPPNLLAHGITLARDPGGPAAATIAVRERIERGDLSGPTLQVAGEVFDTSTFRNLVTTVGSAADVRAEVARQAGLGADWIKLYTGLSPELVHAAIDEARAFGLRVTGHLQATTWTEAARLGIDSLVHAIPGSPALLPEAVQSEYAAASASTTLAMLQWFGLVDRNSPVIAAMVGALVEHDVSLDPTLIVFHSMAHGDSDAYRADPALALVPRQLVDNWRAFFNFNVGWQQADFTAARRLYPQAEAFVKMLHDAGVTLTAGTDANNPWIVPGDSFHRELELLANAGIRPLDVLTIATANGARALGVLSETGTIEAGKRADLVLLDHDPVADITAARSILWVMKGGRRFEPAELIARFDVSERDEVRADP